MATHPFYFFETIFAIFAKCMFSVCLEDNRAKFKMLDIISLRKQKKFLR